MDSQTKTFMNWFKDSTSDTLPRYEINELIAFYSANGTNPLAIEDPTPTSESFFRKDLVNSIQEMSRNSQLSPAQAAEKSRDPSQSFQPPQADHAQYYTPSETTSSPDGSVGKLTPSPKKKAKSNQKQCQSKLRNQYIPTPTTETHNTVEKSDDINNNSARDMSAEAMSMAGNNLQCVNNQANSGVNFARSNAAIFTNNNDHSNMGRYYTQNLGYQNGQLPFNPHAAVFPPNQPFNTGYMNGPMPSNFASTNSIAHIYPQQHIPVINLETDDVNTFDADSMVAANTSKVRHTIPTEQFNPQKQLPLNQFKAHSVDSYNQRQTSSPSSHTMSKNSHPMKSQKEASQGQQKAGYFQRLLSAMKDIDNAQDNAGMVDTWEKMMNTKQMRIQQVCRELVEKVYEAQEMAPVPLGENNKSIVEYKNVADRMSKLESVLTTQKTICKHLLDDPYIDRVVTDPGNAQRLVEANRRVNYQKKQNMSAAQKVLGVKGRGKGVPLRAARKARKSQEESGDECEGTSGNTNNSPENQASNQDTRRSGAKRTHADVEDEDEIETPIKKSPSKRVKKSAHGRTKSAPALQIDMVAASPLKTLGAGQASAHRHSNSYPGHQSAYRNGMSATMVGTPTSGLPYTSANPHENLGYSEYVQSFPSCGLGTNYGELFDDTPCNPNPFSPTFEGYDMGGNYQSPQGDN